MRVSQVLRSVADLRGFVFKNVGRGGEGEIEQETRKGGEGRVGGKKLRRK